MSGNFTLFQNAGGGGGGGGSEYLQDAFNDISTLATANTGFSSTVSTNPLSNFFLNDDAPRFSVKTLWIKDLVQIQDRSKWIDNKPTYEIVWSENFSPAKGYVAGNVRLRNIPNGKCVEIKNINDIIGVGGVIRQIAWILNPSTEATATADLVTDGVDTGADASFQGASFDNVQNGVNHFHAFLHSASVATKDIHDYRLQANEYGTLNVAGVMVYFQNTNSDIDLFPGSTYVDKEKQTTTVITGATLPVIVGKLGAKSVVYKTATNTYSTSTVETPYLNTIGQGASGTNLLSVTTGHGASYPAGVGIVGAIGSSFYVGSVVSVSTDTLTVNPTLPFGVSGLFYKSWNANASLAISATLYSLAQTIDPTNANAFQDTGGFNRATNGDFYYSDPDMKYRVWGDQLQMTTIDGYRGVAFNGNTTGFLQVAGKFCAAEIEVAGSGILHGTMSINGINAWGINQGFSGIQKFTVFGEAGPGFNMFSFSPGQSLINCAITQINLYERAVPANVTLGRLASFDAAVDKTLRFSNALNVTTSALGNWQRVYSDRLFLQGNWVRAQAITAAGGIQYTGSSTNSVLKLQYHGTDFGLIGTAGSSAVLLFDGASIAVTLNAVNSVATLGFHTVEFQHKGGTSIISALDFLKDTQTELVNEQKFLPREELDDAATFYFQSETPRKSKDGDIWVQDKFNRTVWLKAFGVWNQVQLGSFSDDPNVSTLIRAFGETNMTTGVPSGVSDMELFNLATWTPGPSDTVGGVRASASTCENSFNNILVIVGGQNAAGTILTTTRHFNKASWSAGGANAAMASAGACQLNERFFIFGGIDGGGAAQVIQAYNGATWASLAAVINDGRYLPGVFRYQNTVHIVGGSDGTANAKHDSFNGVSISAETAVASANQYTGGSRTLGGKGIVWGQINDGTGSYEWSGSWSASITLAFSCNSSSIADRNGGNSSGFVAGNNCAFSNGGSSSGDVVMALTQKYNGASWTSTTSSTTARSASSGGAI